MLILGIDTSSKTSAVGLLKDDLPLGNYTLTGSVYHSESLNEMIDDILKKQNLKISDIDLFAVGIGPGSFTGLRIGITIAKVMAFALDVDVIGVSSLVANSMSDYGLVSTIVDARRGNVYASIIKNEDEPEVLFEDEILPFEKFKDEVKKYDVITIAGLDGEKFIGEIENAKLSKNKSMRGSNIARLGLIDYKKNGPMNAFNLVPNYLKISQAEAQYEKNNETSK